MNETEETSLIDKNEKNFKKKKNIPKVLYKVNDIPPFMLTVFLSMQHLIVVITATLPIIVLTAPALCMGDDHIAKSELAGNIFVSSGLITFIQTIFGVRLQVLHMPSFSLLIPILGYLNLPNQKCPDNIVSQNYNITMTNESFIISGSYKHREIWMSRLREVGGCVILASVFEMVIGLTGLIGYLMKYLGPLTICPTFSLIGFSFIRKSSELASTDWNIAVFVFVSTIFLSLVLGNIKTPFLFYSKKRKCYRKRFRFFRMFSLLISISIAWFLSYILTIKNYFPSNPSSPKYKARTDLRNTDIIQADWFKVPYPGQYGWPIFSIGGGLVLLSSIFGSIIESVADYKICANLSGAPPPPVHAANRGVFVESLGSFFSAFFGTGNGTTASSLNIGTIGINRVGSTFVIQVTAFFLIMSGLVLKVAVVLLSIPSQIIGGLFYVLFGMMVSLGLTHLQHVNLNSSRNLFILGFSLFFGYAIPEWITFAEYEFSTGLKILDDYLNVLLKAHNLVGGLMGFFLDNLIPGSAHSRGIVGHEFNSKSNVKDLDLENRSISNSTFESENSIAEIYDLPFFMNWYKKLKFLKNFSICPSFQGYEKDCSPKLDFIGNQSNPKLKIFCNKLKIACNKDTDDESDSNYDSE